MTHSEMILETVVVGPLETNCYILGCPNTKQAILIDPGAEPDKIKNQIKKHSLKLNCIINTHGHFDHIGANAQLAVPVYIHKLDAGCLTKPELNFSSLFGSTFRPLPASGLLEHGQKIAVGTISLEVLHTPGHSPGGICLKTDQLVFTGDTLFAQGVGRTDIPGGSEQDLFNSIRGKLLTLPQETIIYPGHGPASTIGKERENNPFL